MDKGHYDEAIRYFSEVLKTDQHYHVKLALASAYAGRAGVRLEQIYAFVAVKDCKVPELKLQGLPANQQTKELMNGLSQYSENWKRIPVVTSEGRSDLLSALKVLESDKEPGVRLYSATLRAVVLKSFCGGGCAKLGARVGPEAMHENSAPLF